MIEPLISVIIPVYNTAPWLRKCLDSIINQTYRNLEIICVNDGSTDDSASILDAYAAKDARIKVIHQTTNAGLSAARNAGLRAATGVYVSGVDSDDYLDLHAYSVLLPHLQDEPDMVCFGIRGVNGAGRDVSSSYMQFPGAGDYTPDVAFLLKSNAYFCNKLFNLKKVREWKVEFPVGLRHEDVAFVYACMPQCEKVRCVADTLYNYLQRDGSISNSARMQLCAYDFCLVLESLYGYYRRRGLFPRLKMAYEALFVYYFEYPVQVLRGGERRRAMREYQRMIRRTGMWREYRGRYPFEEILRYNPLRALFYWRNATTRLYKFLKWPVLRIEETQQGTRFHWF